MDKIPYEIKFIIFEYVNECKSKQNMYVNKDIYNIFKKINKCKCEVIFNRKVCTKCFKSQLRQINLMFMPFI